MWKIIGGAIVLTLGVLGVRRYMRTHQHVDTCPTAEAVRAVVNDLDTNKITIMAAQLRADAWEHDGCQIAADSVRAMIKVRQAKEALATATLVDSTPTMKTAGDARARVFARR